MMTDLSSMESKIRELEERVSSLRSRWPEAPRVHPSSHEPYDQAMTELSNSLEELHVLYEELESRNDALGQAYEDAQQERRRYQELFDFAPDAYLVTDVAGNITEANVAAARLLGCPPGIRPSQPLRVYVPASDRLTYDRLLSELRTPMQTGLEKQLFIQGLVGPARSCSARIAPVQGLRGELLGFRWMLRDLSERRALEALITDAAIRAQQRIGQELHDGICQQLAGIGMLASTLQQQLRQEVSREMGLDRLVEYIHDAQQQVRRMSHGLMPSEVHPSTLALSLGHLATAASELHNIRCEVDCDPALLVRDSSTASHLFRITQEAVHNAVRHGRAGRITITFKTEGDRPALKIRDDGCGLPEDFASRPGIGLRSMRYRAEAVGAEMRIVPADGGGVEVACLLPADKG